MPGHARARDLEAERLERDAYVLLQHVRRVTEADPAVRMLGSRVADQLGFDRAHAARILRFLSGAGLLRYDEAGPTLSITLPGIAYVDRIAGRRRTVRALGS